MCSIFCRYRNSITLGEAGIPEYEEVINNKQYSTSKSILLCYTIENQQRSDDYYSKIGTYFEGLYKTKNGNYFIYRYYSTWDNPKRIKISSIDNYNSFYKYSKNKLVPITEAFDIEEA